MIREIGGRGERLRAIAADGLVATGERERE
jgi:hypothetical protein